VPSLEFAKGGEAEGPGTAVHQWGQGQRRGVVSGGWRS